MPHDEHDVNELTDEEIIALYKKGESGLFKNLIDRYTSPLYNFTARIGGRNDASDIVQETFIKAWRNINRFDETKASFKTWIFTITRNTVTDFLRKRRNVLFSDIPSRDGENDEVNSFIENIPDEKILPDSALAKLQDTEVLNEALGKLKDSHREVLILHYQEEMTFDEIGKILNKPLNTVKSTHRRALIELRKLL